MKKKLALAKKKRNETAKLPINNRKEILAYFSDFIKNDNVPQKADCLRFVREKNSDLDYLRVKNIVYAKIQCIRKAKK